MKIIFPIAKDDHAIPLVMMGALELWDDSGASIHMREVMYGLSNHGFSPCVICLPSRIGSSNQNQLKEVTVPVIRKRFFLQISWNIAATIKAIKAVRKSGSKIIYTRLEPGMFAGMVAAAITRTKLVVEMNGLPTLDLRLYRPNNKFLLAISHLWETAHYRFATAIIGAPGYISLVKHNFHIPGNKLHAVPLGVNTELFRPMERIEALSRLGMMGRPTVVWVGSIAGWQGLEVLVKATAILKKNVPNSIVNIIGDGPDLLKLKKIAIQLNLQGSICFVGRVPYNQIPFYIGASTVCVCTFPGNRGKEHTISALKTLNYLACGRPVVTTSMDEMSLKITQTNSGITVPPDDENAIAVALTEILLEGVSKWSDRCENAKKLVRKDYSWESVTGELSRHLRRLI